MTNAGLARELNTLAIRCIPRQQALLRELKIIASMRTPRPQAKARFVELRRKIDEAPAHLAGDAIAILSRYSEHKQFTDRIKRAAADKNLEILLTEIVMILRELLSDEVSEVQADPSKSAKTDKELERKIRQHIKADKMTHLSDEWYLCAYRQEGSYRKAAAFLSKQVSRKVSKDKVARAVRRFGGPAAALQLEDSESVKRTVASQSRDRLKKNASPTKPPNS